MSAGGSLIEQALEVLSDPFLVMGAIAGLVVLGVGVALPLVWQRDGPLPIGGLLVAAATMAVLAQSGMLGLAQFLGVTLLAIGGLFQRFAVVATLFATAGAFFLIRPETGEPDSWLPWFGLLAIVLTAPLVAAFDDRYARTGLSLPLFGIAALGVFLTVPNTEGSMVLLGVAGTAGFLGWPRAFASLGRAGSYAAVGVYVFVATEGATGRPASIIASVAVLGLLLIVPIAMRLRNVGLAGQLDRVGALFPLFAQLAFAVLISRTAGRVEGVVGAAVLTVGSLVTAGAVLVVVHSRRPTRLPDERP